MAAFDYERCWGELLQLLEEDPRPNWGARQLREEMARMMARNQRPLESGLAQGLRLYGVEVDLQELVKQRVSGPTSGVAFGSPGTDSPEPAHRVTKEVIDGAGHAGRRIPADADGDSRRTEAA